LSLEAVALLPAAGTVCLPAAEIPAAVLAKSSGAGRLPAGALALLPPGLVAPELKVLPIGEADLFGARITAPCPIRCAPRRRRACPRPPMTPAR